MRTMRRIVWLLALGMLASAASASMWLGDVAAGSTLHFAWSTNAADGASVTRATNGTVRVYKNNVATAATVGVTDTEDFGGLTGVHACTIDLSTSSTFYAAGADYVVVLAGAVIDGATVNAPLAEFSIANRPVQAMKAGLITATVAPNLDAAISTRASATNLATVDGIVAATASEVTAIKAKTDNLPASPAAVGSQMDLVNAPNATAVAAIQNGLATAVNLATVDGIVAAMAAIIDNLATALEVDGAVYRFTANALEQSPSGSTPPSAASIADAVWDEAQGGHVSAGTFGSYLDAAVSGVGGATGSGADSTTITLTVSSVALADASVWISSNASGTAVVAGTLTTDDSGEVVFLLDAGTTYYLWMKKAGYADIRGTSFVASASGNAFTTTAATGSGGGYGGFN